MTDRPPLERRSFRTPALWRRWLHRHHARAPGLWIQFAKKDSGLPTVIYAEALEVALCYGWIDGQVKGLDATHYLQKWTPRATRSIWSKVNREKALALIARGEMQPAGLAAVQAAQADGRWAAAYDSPRRAEVPPDLAAALAEQPAAAAFFQTLSGRNRYAILHRLQTAKLPATRVRRLAQFMALLAEGKTLYP